MLSYFWSFIQSPDKIVTNLKEDKDVWATVNYVYDVYLKHPYPNEIEPTTGKMYKTLCSDDWELKCQGKCIPRPNHGIAHTLRGAFMIPILAQCYQSHCKNMNDAFNFVTSDAKTLKRLQIALLFAVVGRKNEMGFKDNAGIYMSFRYNCAKAFEKYARAHLSHLFSEKEIGEYSNLVLNFGDSGFSSARAFLMRQCHNLDLLRCYKPDEMNEKFNAECKLSRDLGHDTVQALLEYSNNLIEAMGDRVCGYHKNCDYNFNRFYMVSKSPERALEAMHSIESFVAHKVVSVQGKQKKHKH